MFGRRRSENLIDTAEMQGFFERLGRFNQEQLLSMRAAWQTTSREAHEDAWTTVRAVAATSGLSTEIERVRKKALAWTTKNSNTIPYQLNNDRMWQQIKMEAAEAIVDAALAVALGDRLDAQSHDILIEPWLRATEQQG
jgi:hypothetical protein